MGIQRTRPARNVTRRCRRARADKFGIGRHIANEQPRYEPIIRCCDTPPGGVQTTENATGRSSARRIYGQGVWNPTGNGAGAAIDRRLGGSCPPFVVSVPFDPSRERYSGLRHNGRLEDRRSDRGRRPGRRRRSAGRCRSAGRSGRRSGWREPGLGGFRQTLACIISSDITFWARFGFDATPRRNGHKSSLRGLKGRGLGHIA